MKIKWNYLIYHGKSEINRYSIESVDARPFSDLIATSAKDGLIKLWYLEPKKAEKNKTIFSLEKGKFFSSTEKFCTVFENHQGAVNIVRWSIDGKLLASGGDDGKLIIQCEFYCRIISQKIYRIFYIFKNNQNDIISLNWSYDSNFITTISLNNNITIYAIKKKYIFARILSRVFSWKGSCWDPCGYFLITQSNSQGIKIWRTSDWKLFKTVEFYIKSKFDIKCSQYSNIGKPNWSACGRYVIFFDNFTIEQIHFLRAVERKEKFTKYKVFLNGKIFINNIRGSLRIYSENTKSKVYSIFAITTEDGKVYLWTPSFSKITILIKNLCGKIFTDISWSFDGYKLYLSTSEGNVFFIFFSFKELGKVIKIKEHENFLGLSFKIWKNYKTSLLSSNYKKEFYDPRNLTVIKFFSIIEFKKIVLKLFKLYKKLINFEIDFEKNENIEKQFKTLPQNFKIEIDCKKKFSKKNLLDLLRNLSKFFKNFNTAWFKSKYKIYFLKKHEESLGFEILCIKYPINYLENKFFTIINFTNGKIFEIISILKNDKKIFRIEYCFQIRNIILKKNFIIISSTVGFIDVLKSNNLQRIFFFDFIKMENFFFDYLYDFFGKKLHICSGFLLYL
jgi:WD40 repeat protein